MAVNPPTTRQAASGARHDESSFDLSRVIAHEKAAGVQATTGLALSGGGIRSATFNLGVLQALAAAGKLPSIDMLSTVSGGGYIGSWLSAWIHRKGLAQVAECLGKSGVSDPAGTPASNEPPEVTWLRRYSNYLTPRIGLLSFDSLTLITTWWRNVALNSIIILGCLVALFIAPVPLIMAAAFARRHPSEFGGAAAVCGIVFFGMIAYNLWHQSIRCDRSRGWCTSTPGVIATVVAPGLLAAVFTAGWVGAEEGKTLSDVGIALGFVVILLVVLFIVWALADKATLKTRWESSGLWVVASAAVFALASGMTALAGCYFAWHKFLNCGAAEHWSFCANAQGQPIMLLWLGPPAMVLVIGITTTIFTGMVGRFYFERSREWWSRLNAWMLALATVWAVWLALAFFSLPLLQWIAQHIGGWIGLLGTGWIGSLLTTLLFRQPEAAARKTQMRVDLVLNIAAAVFIVGLLIVLSAFASWSLMALAHITPFPMADSLDSQRQPQTSLLAIVIGQVDALRDLSTAAVHPDWPIVNLPVAATAGLLLLAFLFSLRVDINKFSLHNMYKNRLVRCYLGASNGASRNEQPFTGLDDEDDISLAALSTYRAADADVPGRVQRPLHILNTTLNITQGRNLAWQERKAASFVFTPIACGYELAKTQGDTPGSNGMQAGYRPTFRYADRDAEERGFTLGMAMATSGAAVSPNMGRASQPMRAFVLTLFNVRLGRWSANPPRAAWREPSPRFGLVPLLQELFGYSNENRNFVYLSDGGHFDNLGLYELVRRRCKTIFVVDAGADPQRQFADLAAAIQKCRVDLGVEIVMDRLSELAGDTEMRSTSSYTLGVIRYDSNDASADGKLVLIKPSMSLEGSEPADVVNYAAQNPPFPQQPTADQFFDESQFESYRRLGLHIGTQCFAKYRSLLPEVPGGAAAVSAPISNSVARPRMGKTGLWLLTLCTATIARALHSDLKQLASRLWR